MRSNKEIIFVTSAQHEIGSIFTIQEMIIKMKLLKSVNVNSIIEIMDELIQKNIESAKEMFLNNNN